MMVTKPFAISRPLRGVTTALWSPLRVTPSGQARLLSSSLVQRSATAAENATRSNANVLRTTNTGNSNVAHVQQNPASRPYARQRPDLPQPPSYRLPMTLLIVFSALTWSAFAAHSTNRERLSSSVLKSIVDKLSEDVNVRRAIGEDVHLKREAWLAGDPWIRGSVNMMQGRVDMSFKITGMKDSGKVYFSAIRRDAQTPYETLRFLIVLDSNKQTISLLEQ